MTNGECIYRKTVDYVFRMALEKDDFRRFSVIWEYRVTANWGRGASCIKVGNRPLTCNCRIKRGSGNNSEMNKFSQTTILFYYNRLRMHHYKNIFSRLQENAFLGHLSFKNFPGEHAPRPP